MKHFIQTITLSLGLLCTTALPGFAGELLNVDHSGVAVKGYDPVAYFTDHKAVKGDEKFQSEYKGAKYDFASADHKATFEKNPAK